jgi:hypothetical protein
MFPHREPQLHADWWSIERLVPILLIIVLIGVVVWAVLRLTRQPVVVPAAGVGAGSGGSSPAPIADPAVEQVRQRYARGELDRDTFLQIVGDLSPRDGEAGRGDAAGAADDPPPSVAP